MQVATEQLLLRGAVLRKSQWAVGVVVYTGMQTKLKMNDEETPPKTTQVEHLMNKMIVLILKVQSCLVVLFGALSFIWQIKNQDEELYLVTGSEVGWFAAVKAWCTYMLLLSPMIPISLYVTLEIVRVWQWSLTPCKLGS